jgi:glutamine synthetase
MRGLQEQWDLRPPASSRDSANMTSKEVFPASIEQALDYLEEDEYLKDRLHPSLVRAYVALRRAEAERASAMTLQDEVNEAFQKS